MTTAEALRALAGRITEAARESSVISVAYPITQACVDHLRAIARVHEVNAQSYTNREKMIRAILDRHMARSLACFPEAHQNIELCRAENETYRPYAEADVDAIIEALR